MNKSEIKTKTKGMTAGFRQFVLILLCMITLLAWTFPVHAATVGVKFTKVAAGDFHGLGIATDGSVWAWGYNSWNSLGDNTSIDRNVPVKVSGLPASAIAVATSNKACLALLENGTVWQWGRDLATINTTYFRPQQLTTLSKIVAIEVGNSHYLALKDDGTVFAWGDNGYGSVGTQAVSATAKENLLSTPTQVPNLSDVKAISGKAYASYALKTDGTVWAWGFSTSGSLGNTTAAWLQSTPIQMSGLTDVKSICGGYYSLFAIKKDTVWACGTSSFGQVPGITSNQEVPVQIKNLPSNIIKITGNDNSGYIATTADGKIWVWGRNYQCELGDGLTTDRTVPIQLTSITSTITDIALGYSFGVASTSDGSLWTWGKGYFGQLADGTNTDRCTPALLQYTVYGNVTVDAPTVAAANAAVGSQDAVLYRLNLTSDKDAKLTGLTVTTGGTYQASDISSFKLRYSADAKLDASDATLSTVSSVGSGSNIAFSGLSQSIPKSDASNPNMAYLFVTADISSVAVNGRTVQIASTPLENIAFESAFKSGTTPIAAGGAQTFLSSAVTASAVDVPAGSASRGAGSVLYGTKLTVATADTELVGFNVKTGGTYLASDIGGFKLYYSADGTFSADDTLLASAPSAASGSTLSFGDYALQFNGTNTYASVPYNAALNTDKFTVEAWASVSGVNGTISCVLNNRDAKGGFALFTVSPKWNAYIGIGTGMEIYGSDLESNKWTHLAATYDGSEYKFYNNGELKGTLASTGYLKNTSAPFVIGALDQNLWFFNGKIDEVRLWNVARTQAEIKQTMNSTLAGNETGLVAYYDFNAISGTTLPDKTANARHATLYGSPSRTLGAFAFSKIIPSGTSGYLFVVADISPNAAIDRTINITSTALNQLVFRNEPVRIGSELPAGGTQTLYTPAKAAVSSTAATPGTISQGVTDTVIYRLTLAVTDYDATLTGVTLKTAGTYQAADIDRFKLRYSADAVLDVSDELLNQQASVSSGNNLTFKGFSKLIGRGNTGYLFITADINADVQGGRTLNIAEMPLANLQFSKTDVIVSGTNPQPAGGVLTIPLSPYISISAGFYHTIGLKQNKTAWTWGNNSGGQLGDGTTNDSVTAVPVTGLSNVKEVEAGDYFSLALLTNGTIYAWGQNDFGQLGDGTIETRLTPVLLEWLTNVTSIVAGGAHCLALKDDGTVWAWGSNRYGQVGDGTTTNSLTPVRVIGLTAITAIAASGDYSLALKTDGTVYVWGVNDAGQLGDGTTVNKLTPVKNATLSGVKAIAAGDYHALALITADGSVRAWGNNEQGQLGNATNTSSLTPVTVSSLTGVKQIAAGNRHSIAMKTDGTVVAWGSNAYGQLGDKTVVNKNTAVTVSGLTGVTRVSAGGDFSLALKTDGTLRGWGHNRYGQLGDSTLVDRSEPVIGGVIPVVLITNSGAVSAKILARGGTNQVIYRLDLAVSDADATLAGFSPNTGGDFSASDIGDAGFKLWYSADNAFSADDTLMASHLPVSAGEQLEFVGFSKVIARGTTGYLFVTADVSPYAVGGKKVFIAQTPFENVRFIERNAMKTGTYPIPAGSAQGFPQVTVAISSPAVAPLSVSQSTNDVIIYRLNLAVTDDNAILSAVHLTTGGTYLVSDIIQDSFRLRYSKDAILDSSDIVIAIHGVVLSGNTLSFSGISQMIPKDSTAYLFLTADIHPTAGGGRTIYIDNTALSRIGFQESYTLKTGVNPVPTGGVQTFKTAEVTITSPAVPAGTPDQGTSDHVIYRLDLGVAQADIALNSLKFVPTGTYLPSDIGMFRLYYSEDAALDAKDILLGSRAAVAPDAEVMFGDLYYLFRQGTTAHLFITADIGSRAIVRNLNVKDFLFKNLVFSDTAIIKPAPDGFTAAGGVQTFPTPAVAISSTAVAAATVEQDTLACVLYRINLAVSGAGATLTGLTIVPSGTFLPEDITGLRLRYSADAALSADDSVIAPGSGWLTGTELKFNVNQRIAKGTTGYLFVTADIGAANGGRTVNIGTTALSRITFDEGANAKITGTDPLEAGGVQTFPVPTIAISAPAVTAAEIEQETLNNVLYKINIGVTRAAATLKGLTLKTAGTYLAKDLAAESFRLRYSANESLDADDPVLATKGFVTPGGDIVFSGLAQPIAKGAAGYLFVTLDTAKANGARTVSIAATDLARIEFDYGVKSGTAPAGGELKFPVPNIAVTSPAVLEAETVQNTPNYVLYRFNIGVTRAEAVLAGVTVITAGAYLASDLMPDSFGLWYSADDTLNPGDTLLAKKTFVKTGGNVEFTGISKTIEKGTSGYLFVTTNIGEAIARPIYIAPMPLANLKFEFGKVSGTDPLPAGGRQKFPLPRVEISSPTIVPADVIQGAVNQAVYRINLSVTKADAILTELKLKTSGTYLVSDIATNCKPTETCPPPLKLFFSTDDILNEKDTLISSQSIAASGSDIVFTGLTQIIKKNTTGYLFVTANIGPATAGRTFNISELPFDNIRFGYREKTDTDPDAEKVGVRPLPAGGAVTFLPSPPNSLALNGTGDYVNIAYLAALNPANFTATVRAEVKGGDNTRRVVVSSVDKETFKGYELYADTDNKWKFRIGTGTKWVIVEGPEIQNFKWYDLSGTYEVIKKTDGTFEGTMKLYVNGEIFGTSSVVMKANTNTAKPFRIGAQSDDAFYFNGQVDEISIWNVARTQDAIKSNLIVPPKDIETGIVAHWPVDPWSTLSDSTGNNNTGTLTGDPKWSFVLAGLWIGQVEINQINESGNKTDTAAPKKTINPFDMRLLLHVNNDGKVSLLREATLMQKFYSVKQADGTTKDMTRRVIVTDDKLLPNYQGVARRDGKLVGIRLGTVFFDFDTALDRLAMSGSVAGGSSVSGELTLEKNHPNNPFRHMYHPDHKEGRAIHRKFTLTIDDDTSKDPLAGSFKFKGVYEETIKGLHKVPAVMKGTFTLNRVSGIGTLNDE